MLIESAEEQCAAKNQCSNIVGHFGQQDVLIDVGKNNIKLFRPFKVANGSLSDLMLSQWLRVAFSAPFSMLHASISNASIGRAPRIEAITESMAVHIRHPLPAYPDDPDPTGP